MPAAGSRCRASSTPTSISTSPASSVAAIAGKARWPRRSPKVAAAKRGFTEDDVYARAQRTLEKAILQGTTRMRTHVEVDPRIGLTSFQRDPAAEGRLCLRHRSADLRLSAGGPAQRSRLRGIADRGLRTGRGRDRRLPLYRQRSRRPYRAHFRDREALRPRCRFPSRFRSRPFGDVAAGSLPADRGERLGRSRRHRPCHQAVGALTAASSMRWRTCWRVPAWR